MFGRRFPLKTRHRFTSSEVFWFFIAGSTLFFTVVWGGCYLNAHLDHGDWRRLPFGISCLVLMALSLAFIFLPSSANADAGDDDDNP